MTANDVWRTTGNTVVHYDGTGWSRLGVIGADQPQVVASPRTVYLSGVSASTLLR